MKIFNHVGFGSTFNLEPPIFEQINNEGPRFYLVSPNVKYPSITTVLGIQPEKKAGLAKWAEKIGYDNAEKEKKRTASRGTLIHEHAEFYLKNKLHELPEIQNVLYRDMFNQFIPVLDNIDNIHCQESRLFSHHLRMAGTVDCIGEYEGKLSIIDFKTANKAKREEYIPDYFMQCAAYAIMYEELTRIPITNLTVLISIENDEPQVFKEKRDNWVDSLLDIRDYFEYQAIKNK